MLSQALRAAEAAVALGERDPAVLARAMEAHLATAPLARVQYAEVVDADTLQPVEALSEDSPSGGRYLAAVAVFFGATRLIDNTTLVVGSRGGGRLPLPIPSPASPAPPAP